MMSLKKIFLALIAAGLFLGFFNVVQAADATQSRCFCYNYYGHSPSDGVPGRTTVKEAMVSGMDAKAEDSCNQLCANEQINPDISKRPTLYAFRENGTEKPITKTPGAVVTEAPANFCTCDSGSSSTKELISRQPVNTREGCILLCNETQGATRMRFNDGAWEDPIPAPIGSIKTEQPTKFKYKLLESFPGFFTAGSVMTDLPGMILAIYKFGIWTVGIAGLFMLVVGGFMYMTSAGNTSTASSARGIIWDALLGIVAALGAYLILYVINPNLTKISLDFTPVKVKEAVQIPSGTMSDADARALLKQNGIDVTSSGNCSDINNSSCTSLQGIPERAISNLVNLKQGCKYSVTGCVVTVTGGTETGHQSHGIGQPVFDVNSNPKLKQYLLSEKSKNQLGTIGISQICTTDANQDLRYNCPYSEPKEHFHLSFGL